VTLENLPGVLATADAVIVGTSLKDGGDIWNPVDRDRAHAFMEAARAIRRH